MSHCISLKYYLCPIVFSANKRGETAVIRIVDQKLEITDFEEEIASTLYLSEHIALINSDRLDEFLFDDLALIYERCNPAKLKEEIDALLRGSGIYAKPGDKITAIELPSGNIIWQSR